MKETLFNIKSFSEFEHITKQVFKYQFKKNRVYRSYCDLLNVHPDDIKDISAIPFLPIEFFKSKSILSTKDVVDYIFTSSGTTGQTSKHHVTDLSYYELSYNKGFKRFYGDVQDYTVLALLPNYLERTGSSLIYMVDDLIKRSHSSASGFYLNNLDELAVTLRSLDKKGNKILLIGVSFALLDLIDKHQFQLENTIVMETGGMKGRRKEIIRAELHKILCRGFGVSKIHSEYGMTELLSQAYSKGNGIFELPPWLRVFARNTLDPLDTFIGSGSGGLNVIDLANYNSCSFIATQDLGRVYDNGTFEVLGRFDHSAVRGCNLMVL